MARKVKMIPQYLKEEKLQQLLFTKSMVDATHTYTPRNAWLSIYIKNQVDIGLDIYLSESPSEVIIFYS